MPSAADSDDGDPALHSLPAHQRAAAASPRTALSDLVGNFTDLESLFDRLGQPSIIELGKPVPDEKFLPGKRA